MLFCALVSVLLPHFLSAENPLRFVPPLDITLPAVRTGPCQVDTQLLREGIGNQSAWAVRMYDASVQGSSGALYGSTWQLGNFDECLQVQKPIYTQYCLLLLHANFSHTNGNGETWKLIQDSIEDRRYLRRDVQHPAVCVPASCTHKEIEDAINDQIGIDNSPGGVRYQVHVVPDMCTIGNNGIPWNGHEISFGIFIILLLGVTIIGTTLSQSILSSTSQRWLRALMCFSFPDNWDRLLDVQPADREHPFAALHGVKVLSMVLVLMGHKSGVPLGAAVSNYEYVEEFQKGIYSIFLMQQDLIVDTFFFMSGVLATHFVFHMYREKRITILQAVVARLVRIAPAYYVLVWFQASVAGRIGSGPLWNYVQKVETENCQNYWWANVLFIQNYLPAEKLCHIHSWYLGCDVHFFLMTFLLVWILMRQPMVGQCLLWLLIVLTPIFPAYAVFKGSLDPLILFYDSFHSNPRADPSFGAIYITSHMRVTVYLIGMAVGYFLLKPEIKNEKHIILSKMAILGGVGLAGILLIAPIAVGGLYYSKHTPGPLFSAVYAAFRRPMWAFGLSVLLIIHSAIPKNFVSRMFSTSAALILSKLTYTMYLVHFPLILYTWAQTRSPQTISIYDLYNGGSGDLIVTTIISTIIFITIELPIKRLLREVIFTRAAPRKTSSPAKSSTNQEVFTVTVKF